MERKHSCKHDMEKGFFNNETFVFKGLCLLMVVGFLSISIIDAKAQDNNVPRETQKYDSIIHRNFYFMEAAEPWLTSRNAAALTRLKADNISTAKLSLTREHGELTNFSGADNVTDFDAAVASYFRINKQTVVTGSMSYGNFTGKNMGGSAFIHSERLPFDIEEDSLTNLGKKHLDTYRLSGGVGIELYNGLSVGTRLDYTAANYAKYKDLRHKNKLMDMTLTIGAIIPICKFLTVGANYYYRRNTESVTFNTYGRNEKVYKSFINYGPFIGKVEQFEGNGLTEKGREMPLVDDYNGASVQLGLTAGRFVFCNELTAAHRVGYYGRKSPHTITFTHHASNVYEYRGHMSWREKNCMHLLEVWMNAENLDNSFSTYRENSNDNGAYYYKYYNEVKTANKLWVNGWISYTLHLGIDGEMPSWTITPHYRWMHRKQTAYEYPYYRRQRLGNQEFGMSLSHNLLLKHGVLSMNAQGAYIYGKGKPFEDLTFDEPSDKQTPPPTMEVWLYREHLWLTAAQYSIGGSVKFTFALPAIQTAPYIEFSAQHRKANEYNGYCKGRDHTTMTIAVGCHF